LIAPYSSEPGEWMTLPWRNRYDPDGPAYTISTGWTNDDRNEIGVQTYADILANYRRHPESKFADPDGEPCTADTAGQLHRRRITQESTRYIGKEADLLDEVGTGLTAANDDPTTDYTSPADPAADVRDWLRETTTADVLAALRATHPTLTDSDVALQRLVQRTRNGAIPRRDALRQLRKASRNAAAKAQDGGGAGTAR
jgi:hypothetical protein